ncbi:molecular chaperone DnaJ [Pseudomonas aeruginosa]|uniref:molecular chaperone DnaJ n=1 Tax=Pseudomonas aeruginosa TaxID=287 RepID=UPI00093785BB|nr:molecular chaperone DnaJ [Pseudomonas aeruginosa]MCT5519316.1 molecular chaperone DnaJ [Pseudomonas aeruginosa]MEE2515671.1 molecular chaperone DnaJ [Pseudomonas aeruginosa]HEJ1327452.1 molecular chaperone DnaJ [Pseudomonas aeruginosa]
MHEIKSNLYLCAHCSGVGTCRNGINHLSCAVCIKEHELKGKEFDGLPCGVCGGIGQAEPRTERINKRMPALLGFMVVFLLMLGVFVSAATKSQYFNQVLAFAAPLIGTVLGFYYSSRNKT